MRPILIPAIAGIAVAILSVPASSQDIQVARKLGSLIAAEEFCGLSYNQEAIAAFISSEVPAEDMDFASMLNTMTMGAGFNQENMTASGKTAHCTQMQRVAKTYGFVVE